MASSRRPLLPTDPGGGGEGRREMREKMMMDRSWIWGNGSVVCDKWMRHGKCSREGCVAEHRFSRAGERVPVCYDHIINKDGCTYRNCPLEHREKVPRPDAHSNVLPPHRTEPAKADVASGRKDLPPVPTGFKLGSRPESTTAKETDTKVDGGRELSRVDKGKEIEEVSSSLSLGTGIDRLVTGSPDMQSGGAALWDYGSRSPSPDTQCSKLNGATTSLLLPPKPVQAQNKVTPARFVNSKTSPEVLAHIREVGTGAPPQQLDLKTMEVRKASPKPIKITYTTRTIRQKEGPVVVSDAKPKDEGIAVDGNSQLEKSQARNLSPTTARNAAKSLAEQYKHHGKPEAKEYSVPMEANRPAPFLKQFETIDSVHRRHNSQDSASSGHSSSIIAAPEVLIPEKIAAVLAQPKPKIEEYVEPPYRWQRNSRPHWDVLRCFNCWCSDHHAAIFCQFGPRSLEQKERLRIKRGIINRRFTEMMLLTCNIHILQRTGTYYQHLEYMKMWPDARSTVMKDGLPASVPDQTDREPGTVTHPVDIWTPQNPPVVTPRRPSPEDDFCMPGPQPPKVVPQPPQTAQLPQASPLPQPAPLPQTAPLPPTTPKPPAVIPPHLKRVYAQQDRLAMSVQSQVPISSQSSPAAPKELTVSPKELAVAPKEFAVAPKQLPVTTEGPRARPKEIPAADMKRPAVTKARPVVLSQPQHRDSPMDRTVPPPQVQQPVFGKEPITTRAKPQRSPSPGVRIVTSAKAQQKVAPKPQRSPSPGVRIVTSAKTQRKVAPNPQRSPSPGVRIVTSAKTQRKVAPKPQRSPSPGVRIITSAKTQQKVAPKSKTAMKPSTNGSAGSSDSEGKNGCWHCSMDDHTFSQECLRRKITPGSIESIRQTAPPALTRKAIIAAVTAPPKPCPKSPRKPSPKPSPKVEPKSEVSKGKQPERRIQSLEPDEIKDPSLAIVRPTGWIQGKALTKKKKKSATTPPHDQHVESSAHCWGNHIDFDFDPMSPKLIRSEEDRKKPLPQKYSELGVKPTTTAVRIFDRNVYLHRREDLQSLPLLQRNAGIAAKCRQDQWRLQDIPDQPSRCAKIPLLDAVIMPTPVANLATLPAELMEMILLDVAGDDPNLMSSGKIRAGSNFNPVNFETKKRHRNLRALQRTCKSLAAVVQEIVFRYVGLTKYSAIMNFIKVINEYPHLAHHVQAVKFQVVKSPVRDSKEKMHHDVVGSMMIVLLESCTELQILSVEMPHALYGFGAITGQFPNMREIQIKDWGSPGMVLPRMWSNLGLFENLVKFKIMHADDNDYRDFTPLELPGHRMSLTIQRLPKKLKTLIMENAPELSDRYLEVICTHCPELETLYVVNCKLVTTVGFTKGIKLMGKRLRQMTFHLWQNANGQPLQVDRNASDADNYKHHLCAVIRDAAPHIEKCCLRVFRCCDTLWDDVVFEKLKVFQLGMYQYRHCHQTRHVPEDEEKFEMKIKDAVRAGRFPERRVLGAMLRRPGLSFQASDN